MMNSRQRIASAFQRGIPDRVPVWCLLSLEHIIRNGTPGGKIPVTIEELVRAECNITRRYNFDGMLVYFPGVAAGTDIEATLHQFLAAPQPDQSHDFASANPENWQPKSTDFKNSDFYSSHLTREIMGPDYHIGGWSADGFSYAVQWFPSLSDAMIASFTEPEKFRKLVDYFDDFAMAWARAQIELGKLDSIQISSPYAGSTFISMNAYRQLVFDSVSKLATTVKEAGGIPYLHTCGNINDRLEVFAETGVIALECMDPPPLGDTTLGDAKQRVGDRLALKGNLDSVNVLLQADEQTFKNVVRDTIRTGMAGGGYILSSACSVAPDVPPERVAHLVELADEYGRY